MTAAQGVDRATSGYRRSNSRALICGWESVLALSQPVGSAMLPHFRDCGATLTSFRIQGRFGFYPDILRLLRTYKPEVVHFHFFNHFSVLPAVARTLGARRVIFTDHVRQPVQVSRLTRLECRVWDRIVLPMTSTTVVAVSEHIRRTLVDFFEMRFSRVQVLYNGVNPERFRPGSPGDEVDLREELAIPAGAPIVLSACSLRPEKGVEYLLRAAKLILAEGRDAYFVILGDGPAAKGLRGESERLGLAPHVRFMGARSDTQRFMRSASLVVITSVWPDPAPLVALEAMACGKPLAASRVGGVPELIEDGVNGVLVAPAQPEELAGAIGTLLDSPQKAAAMGAAGRARVEDRFSIARWVSDTLTLYGVL